MEEPRAASPPLELRRTTSMPLQSPGDRITGKLLPQSLSAIFIIYVIFRFSNDGTRLVSLTENTSTLFL